MNETLQTRIDRIKEECRGITQMPVTFTSWRSNFGESSLVKHLDFSEKAAKSLLVAIEGYEILACLGNGDRWGNSIGNTEAQHRLARIAYTWEGK